MIGFEVTEPGGLPEARPRPGHRPPAGSKNRQGDLLTFGRSECFCKPRAMDKFLPQGERSLVAGMRPPGVHPPPGPWEGADPKDTRS